MTILSLEERPNRKLEIDLSGPAGNAFALIRQAMKFAKQLGYDADQIEKEMVSGDYENLVDVFDWYFGEFVILYR